MTAIHDGDAPARRGAVDDAIRKMRAAAAAEGRDDAPGAAGTVDPAVLRTVLATLPHDDQRLLWDRHVVGRELAAIAADLGMHARAVLRRLRHAEERLGAAFAAAHARACPPGCLDTRQSLHSYVGHRLSPPRRTVLEAHLFACQGCMRAFIDVREAGWAVRDAGPLLLAGTAAGAAAGAPVVVGALGAGTTAAGAVAWSGPVGAALLAAWEWVRGIALQLGQLGKQLGTAGLIGAGTVAGVAVAAVAVALSGGAGGPAAAPPPPGPTSSVVAPAPAPGDAASPDAPPEPEPSATTSAEPTPSEDPSAPPVTDDPTRAPTTDPTTPGTTPADPPATKPGTTPSSPKPSDQATEPTPTPTPTGASSPTPSVSQSPSPPAPTPSTTPTPTPTPDPSPVRTTITIPLAGDKVVYRIDVADTRTEIVEATGRHAWVKVRQCSDGEWYAQSRTYGDTSVRVTLDAPSDVEPEASLTSYSNWRGYLNDC
ncbi:zf-HC2 domain-containing protein [Isoptericola sp. NPDC019482]|uniref:zf-HC2 domain-containing protein n=1 Tax=Isoptericola sp. NPDC019482 TaxID=3154688 RepID=UPI0034799559